MYGCGLRVSELISITVHDINFELGYLRCRGKGSKERIIPVGSFALDAVNDYLSHARGKLLKNKHTQELFLNRLGDKLSRSGFGGSLMVMAVNWAMIFIRILFGTALLRI